MEEEKQQKMKALKKATEDFEKMQQDFEEIMKAKKEELEKATLELDKTKSEVGFSVEGKQDINIKGSENTSLGLQVSAEKTGFDLSKVFRKEFKIQGQIGLENQKDKIGFISLIRQIEAGVSKGYSEAEIVDGVIPLYQPGSTTQKVSGNTATMYPAPTEKDVKVTLSRKVTNGIVPTVGDNCARA